MRDLTPEEDRAIASLERLAKRWPETLWLFSANGTLCVMHCGPDGDRVHTPDCGVDEQFLITTIKIPNDGGDW